MQNKKHIGNIFFNAFLHKFDLANIFIGIIGISSVIYILLSAVTGNGSFADIFFLRGGDFFMDFFNSVRDASQGSGVYTDRRVIYPPMANLIFLIMSRFTPSDYNNTPFSERYDWIKYFSPLLLVVIISIFCAVCIFSLMQRLTKCASKYKRLLFAFLAVFSAPVLYLFERGNILVLCLISLFIYAITYESHSKLKRELGIIALAFAFSLKLYPVIFGWCLISDKRIKDAVRCAIYGGLMILIPSFFFGGPVCLWWMIQNIFSFSSDGAGSTLTIICRHLGLSHGISTAVNIVSYAWVLVCAFCFAVSPFIFKERERFYYAGFATILCIPSLTSLYAWSFMLIPTALSCSKNFSKKAERLISVCATIPFAYIPFRISYHVTLSTVLLYICAALLSVSTVIITLAKIINKMRRSRCDC